jgi:pyridoxal biosynthesis lyase PdxS
MADPEKVLEIIDAVSIPVMGKVRIGHFVEAQILEVLGAMGIKEVRRLRGEVGRAIFQEDAERDSFASMIGGDASG